MVVIIAAIMIIRATQGFITTDDLYGSSVDTHNNLLRLNIFRYSIFIFVAITAGAICIMLTYQIKLEFISIVAVLCIGTAYMFAVTPLSVPDEYHHYCSSYALSGYLLFDEDPFLVDSRHFDGSMFLIHHNVPSAYIKLINEGIYIEAGNPAEMIDLPEPYDITYPLAYFPQVLGVLIARLVGLSFLGIFYLGRVFGLLFYTLCVFLSIRRLKEFKLPLLLIALIPISMHQAASFSYDSFINGVAMLFFAYVISYIYEESAFRWSGYVMILVTAVLLAPAKAVYMPVILLVLLIAWRWKGEKKRNVWLLVSSVITASFIMLFIFCINAMDLSGGALNWEGQHNYTLSFVLAHPLRTLEMVVKSFWHYRVEYYNGVFGKYLSGFTMVLPDLHFSATIILLFAGVLYGKKDHWQPAIGDRVSFISVSAVVIVLCHVAMLIGWTSNTRSIIEGVQGRYFIPLLPLLLLSLRIRKLLIPYTLFRNALLIAYILIQCSAVMFILRFTIDQYVSA